MRKKIPPKKQARAGTSPITLRPQYRIPVLRRLRSTASKAGPRDSSNRALR